MMCVVCVGFIYSTSCSSLMLAMGVEVGVAVGVAVAVAVDVGLGFVRPNSCRISWTYSLVSGISLCGSVSSVFSKIQSPCLID